MATKKPAAVKSFEPHVCLDFNRHTCIVVSRTDGVVRFIPLDILGLDIVEMSSERFDKTWTRNTEYPVVRAATLYAGYAADLGGSIEAMNALASLTPISQQEISMATSKKKAPETAAKTTKPAAKTTKPAAKTTKSAAKATKSAAKTTKPAAAAAAKESGERKPSAAQMFKDLIMAGKMTDDQIFAKVQTEFGLDDNKRGYVKWYRNDLAKKGMNPPAAKD